VLLEPNQEVVMAKPVNENKEMEKSLFNTGILDVEGD